MPDKFGRQGFVKSERRGLQLKEKDSGLIYATQTGDAISLSDVPDPVFSDKLLGDGIAIIPTNGEVKAPVNGEVTRVFDTKHAYSILSDDGLEILVHIGLDTVELDGRGFTPKVKSGERVRVGDTLCEVDLALLSSEEYFIHTPIVITNMDKVKKLTPHQGYTVAGKTVALSYTL